MKKFLLALVVLIGFSVSAQAQCVSSQALRLADPPRNRYPTHMTSINYPTIYGAYETFPVPKTSFSTPYSVSPERDLSKDIKEENARYLKMVSPKYAKVIVILPTRDSILEVQGVKIAGTGHVRTFQSPDLEEGKNFVYTVTARWKDEITGKDLSLTKQMPVTAGGRAVEAFNPWEARGEKPHIPHPEGLRRPTEIKQ